MNMPIVQLCSQYADGAYCLLDSRIVVRELYQGRVVRVYPKRDWEVSGRAVVRTDERYKNVSCLPEYSAVDASADDIDRIPQKIEESQLKYQELEDWYFNTYGIHRHIFYTFQNKIFDPTHLVIAKQLLRTRAFKSVFRANCAQALREWIDSGMESECPLHQYHFKRLGYYEIKKRISRRTDL